MVRLLWLASALLTIASGVIWVVHFQEIMQHGSIIKRAVLPVLVVAFAVVLFFCRGQFFTGKHEPMEPTPILLLGISLALVSAMTFGLKGLGQ
ncbi:MAG: hypothetical protein DIU55_006135 [Bacillota bacterium]